jgi:hypothetical protein
MCLLASRFGAFERQAERHCIVRAARLQRRFHPCGALQFIRAPQRGGFLEEF